MTGLVTFDTTVDCLHNGAPHRNEAWRFVEFFSALPEQPEYDFIRCYITFDLFQKVEVLQEDIHFRLLDYRQLLTTSVELAEQMMKSRQYYAHKLSCEAVEATTSFQDTADYTQAHYSHLFEQFDDAYYYDHSWILLKERFFDRNSLVIADIVNKVALDCGCGGGRFALILKQMGFQKVYGIDLSAKNIQTAQERRDARGIRDVVYEQGDALNLPYPDASFDFVLSNGVLHHTPSIAKGLSEIYRILKPGGQGLLFVMEKPAGIFIDAVELLRIVMRPVNPAYARRTMALLGAAGHRIYTILDHTQVPINTRTAPQKLEILLKEAGFNRFKRLVHGLDYDRIEKLRRLGPDDPDAVWKYGLGETRYFFEK